jgi:hypothetical protein
MNLFRSEEHARNWSGFKAGTDEAILPISAILAFLSTPRHSAKLNPHYVSSAPEWAPLFVERLKEVTDNAEFWNPTPEQE